LSSSDPTPSTTASLPSLHVNAYIPLSMSFIKELSFLPEAYNSTAQFLSIRTIVGESLGTIESAFFIERNTVNPIANI
jgi:hypothetical protein